jgi:hypothetical protein
MAAKEKHVSDELKPELDFVADFRDGEAMAIEWIAGKGALPELMLIVRDMPRDLAGLEAGFLSTVDAAVRGRRGAAGAPDPAKAQMALAAQPSPEAPPHPPIDVDAFRRRMREHELAARLERLARSNAAAWGEQAAMVRRMGWGTRDE